MPFTLLLDLDDTLLNTNVGEFVPAYFQAVAAHLGRWVKQEDVLPALMAGTQRMLANEDPSLTLEQVFDREFYPRLGAPKEQLREHIDWFYDNDFRQLHKVTSPREGARELVDWALAEGYRLAVATDPLFPRKATRERIRWAGLDPDRFELVSSYETFHFSKSHPAYYAELLGRLGWPDGPVLMVGNDEQRDLACAQELGLATFRADGSMPRGTAAEVSPGASRALGHGSLSHLRVWIQSADPATLEPSFHNREAILSILTSSPAVLQGLTSDLSAQGWYHEPTPDDWAVIEIICHLRDTEREVHHPQIEILREEAQPFVPRPDAAVWAKQRKYLDENGPQAVAGFTAARLHTLRELRALDPEVWERRARHAIFGPTNSQEVIGFMADHDRLHIQQAWRTLQATE